MRPATLTLLAAMLLPPAALAAPPRIVAAENFYGSVAARIAGPGAEVTSILSNPDEDPHLFEASPSVARALAGAGIVIYNGIGYDPWIGRLLAASPSPQRVAIDVGRLVGAHDGDNPHLWYDPDHMLAMAKDLARTLQAADPAKAADYAANLKAFEISLAPLQQRIAALRTRFAGTPVTATEPVFGDMAARLGLVMRDLPFQIAVMNDTEPSPAATAAMENDLRDHRVRLFIYNSQATDDAAKRLLGIAHRSGVPTVGVTETEPAGRDYVAWMMDTLDAVQRALAGAPLPAAH